MPDTSDLRSRLDRFEPLRRLAAHPAGVVAGVPSGAVGLLAWWLCRATGRTVVLVGDEVEALVADVGAWAGDGDLHLFPGGDTLPFDPIPCSDEVIRRRLTTLEWCAGGGSGVVVASPSGLVRPTLPPVVVREGRVELVRQGHARRDEVIRRLVGLGYRRELAVAEPGEFAVRGGILDVYPPGAARPWRAEWFGDTVDDLRSFDCESQTSVTQLDRVVAGPARELDLRPETVERALVAVDALDLTGCRDDVVAAWRRDRHRLAAGVYDDGIDRFTPYLAGTPSPTLFHHLPGDAVLLVVGGRARLKRALERTYADVEDVCRQEQARGELPRGAASGVVPPAEASAALERFATVEVVREFAGRPDLALGWAGVEGWAGRIPALAERLAQQRRRGLTTLVLTRQPGRVVELLGEHGLDVVEAEAAVVEVALPPGAVVVTAGDLSQGFTLGAAGLEVLTDHELFGGVRRRGSLLQRGARRVESTSVRGTKRATAGPRAAVRAFVADLAPGDLVVHRDHGIGRFLEMRRIRDETGEHEYMTLEYADGDLLHVPVDHLDRVDRYVGGSDARPHLSKLGSGEWERTRRRVRQRTEEVARELLTLYSHREAAVGHAFAPDGAWQAELEAAFPYEETPDQVLVMEEIKRDMESSRPMDRVVCGDVGFGKTELALRAAFKAVCDGRQVAILVPTTVLAQQHYATFAARLAPFPIAVRQLSRFCSAETAEILAGLRSGAVDIVVGTHRLLQRDVGFRNLGLVIIDEEQRFGVLQKERFKKLRVAVDVLSLSATPIPRTLHMALAGIRDLSVVATPPEERQPVKTYVTAHDPDLIREVISRELARGGQVFYVHNQVRTIDAVADQLRALLPGVTVEVAHGQMREGQLAEVMRRFVEGNIEVLCCTTIIENGLDIPNVNTIVVDDAHRLGLAQLYQLRGRVGRAGQRAYAYFLYPRHRSLTERADKRLDVVADLQDLGAGFRLALRDLEIRGAGNLLGEEQHGEIAAVGLELYNHLLRQAVAELQGRTLVESPVQVTVSLPVAAFLPGEYVGEERLRLRLYQDLAACATEAELERHARGLADRFGPLPPPVEALILSLRVRLLAAACGAQAVEREGETIVVRLGLEHGLDLGAVQRQFPSRVSTSPTRVRLALGPGWEAILCAILRDLGRQLRARRDAATAAATTAAQVPSELSHA